MSGPSRAWPGAATLGAAGFFALQGSDATLPLAWFALAAGGAVALWRDEIDLARRPSRLEASLLVFLAVAAIASAFGLDPRRSFALSTPVLAVVPLWVLIARSGPEPQRVRWIAAALLVAAATQVVLVVIATAALPDADAAERVARAGAMWLVVPNDLAWIACLVPFALLLPYPRASLVVACAVSLVLAVLVRSLTFAGAALLTAIVAALLATTQRLPRGRSVLAAFAALTAAVAGAAFFAPSMLARLQLWYAALVVLRDHPFGVGLHNYVLAYRTASPIAPDALVDPRRTPWPHSLPLEVGAELGWVGGAALAFVVITIWTVLRTVWGRGPAAEVRSPPRNRLESALAAGLAGFAALGISETSFLRLWTWLFGAALLALLASMTTGGGNDGKVDR